MFREKEIFYNLQQSNSESINEWNGRLKNASSTCKFEDNLVAYMQQLMPMHADWMKKIREIAPLIVQMNKSFEQFDECRKFIFDFFHNNCNKDGEFSFLQSDEGYATQLP